MKRGVFRALKIFFKNTTLHGFKYLSTVVFLDRVCWIALCCASTCCAGMLCSVLWMRFQQSPMLLLRNPHLSDSDLEKREPLIAVCPSPHRAASILADKLSLNVTETTWLSRLFGKILRAKPAADEKRILLDQLMEAHNLTLSTALMKYVAPCKELMDKCRWQNKMLPCMKLFGKQLTRWGACCVLKDETLPSIKTALEFLQETETLDLVINCFDDTKKYFYCSELFIKYRGEDWLGPWYMMSGYSYTTTLMFKTILDPVKEKLVNGTCVSDPLYSQSRCMILCKETECGCSHPLRLIEAFETNLLPPCSVLRMKCLLGNYIRDEHPNGSKHCNCLPACERITAYMSSEFAPLVAVTSYDPLYKHVNSNSSLVLNFRLALRASKSYNLIPSESWLTLLSSLGGVFNMFMGVGLFSALECLYLTTTLILCLIRKETRLKPN